MLPRAPSNFATTYLKPTARMELCSLTRPLHRYRKQSSSEQELKIVLEWYTHVTASVVRVPGYRSRGPGLYSRRYKIF
jgi:hypothetical protein